MRNGVQYGNPAIPYASNNVPGLVKVGNGLNIDGNGVLSTSGGGASELTQLSDVNITDPQDLDFLRYDATEDEWFNSHVMIPKKLSELKDVSIPSPQNGNVLTYNSSTFKWEAAAPSGGGSKIYDASGSRYYDSGQWRFSQSVYEANGFDSTKPFVVFLHIDVPAASNQFNDRLACDQTIYLPSAQYGDTYYLHFYTKGGDPRGFLVMSAEVTITNISASAFTVNITLHNDSKKITVSGSSVSSAAYSPSTTYNASFKVGVMQ